MLHGFRTDHLQPQQKAEDLGSSWSQVVRICEVDTGLNLVHRSAIFTRFQLLSKSSRNPLSTSRSESQSGKTACLRSAGADESLLRCGKLGAQRSPLPLRPEVQVTRTGSKLQNGIRWTARLSSVEQNDMVV